MQGTEGDVLLTDLCSICHTNAIKYTCPRCGVHTCSLPCVKRHKSWAQCSGIRDPAAYRKRTDLATPTSIDQDFNFITSVERSLQRADDSTSNRGIDLAPSGLRRDRKTKFDSAIEEREIRLIKAPKGLSRNKLNKSCWMGGSQGIIWTTEWLHYDGRKVHANVPESKTVEEAYQSAFRPKNSHHKKRKRRDSERKQPPTTVPQVLNVDAEEEAAKNEECTEILQIPQDAETSGLHSDPSTAKIVEDELPDAGHAPQVHYYLFKPNTTSKVKCLVPIAAKSKLADVLQGRAVLEFPTFYLRQEAANALPEPFVTEDRYDELYGTDVVVNLPTYESNDALEEGEVIDLESINEQNVLEVLQKDLIG